MRHHKIFKQIAVILITGLLLFLLASQLDAHTLDSVKKGGTIRTQDYSRWQLTRYRDETLPKRYPYKYAPWISYVKIDRYVTIGSEKAYYTLTVDPRLYEEVKPVADRNKATAQTILKRLKVKGKGMKAYQKIYRYVASGKYTIGKKSTADFFAYHEGDCVAHASAFYVLCKVQGIPVRFCIGGVSGDGLHAWNRVKLKGKWRWVDTTYKYRRRIDLWDDHKVPMDMW